MGAIASLLGFDGPHVTLRHVTEFVARLVDGLYLRKPPAVDYNELRAYADYFALALGHSRLEFRRVSVAWMEGVEEGLRSAQRWERGRRRG